MNLQRYILNQEIIRRRIEKKYIPLVRVALQQQIDHIIDIVERKGVLAAQGHFSGDLVNSDLTKAIQGLYKDAIMMALRKFIIVKSFTPTFVKRILDFLSKYLLNKVVLPISLTTVRQIDKALQKSLDEGLGADETVANIRAMDIPKWRSLLIVRTETTRATNFSQMMAADQQPYEMQKQWIAIDDKRTRKTHNHQTGVDGQVVDLYDKFSNGLMYPGDPNGSAEEVCNCRCTLGYLAKRDEDGKLIPKSKKAISLLDLLNAA